MNGGARRDAFLLVAVLAVGALARWAYLAFAGSSRFDPWRHQALVQSLREGTGFTLFDGQPYLWHAPVWHPLVAWLPAAVPIEAWAAALSLGSSALLYGIARQEIDDPAAGRRAALAAAALAALSGPLVAFTCHPGPEALALFTALSALWLVGAAPGAALAAAAGAVFGLAVVLRTNSAFLAPLALPRLRTPGRVAAFAADSLTRAVPVPVVVRLAAVALLLDGVDGKVARRTGSASALGASRRIVRIGPPVNKRTAPFTVRDRWRMRKTLARQSAVGAMLPGHTLS